ncbi:MAG: hypothetical protein Q9162_003858 [Coniocarpon cinnabarinum]
MPQSSYYRDNKPGAALQRARRPYLVRNALTGAAIFCFAMSIYAFTIRAVSQDEFEDVPIPDGPPPAAHAPHTGTNRSGGVTATGT